MPHALPSLEDFALVELLAPKVALPSEVIIDGFLIGLVVRVQLSPFVGLIVHLQVRTQLWNTHKGISKKKTVHQWNPMPTLYKMLPKFENTIHQQNPMPTLYKWHPSVKSTSTSRKLCPPSTSDAQVWKHCPPVEPCAHPLPTEAQVGEHRGMYTGPTLCQKHPLAQLYVNLLNVKNNYRTGPYV